MSVAEWLLFGVAGWSGLGLIGVAISWRRGERQKVRLGLVWIAGVWAVYVCVLLAVSVVQGERTIVMGAPECFDTMCFTVTGIEEVPGFLVRDGHRLLRVSVEVANRGRSTNRDESIDAYLIDAQGRRWMESRGVGGVALQARLRAGGRTVSEPVFQVAGNALGLKLVFTHGRKLPWVLMIGDSDSLLHRPTAVDLER